jgi:hypothetical protein
MNLSCQGIKRREKKNNAIFTISNINPRIHVAVGV